MSILFLQLDVSFPIDMCHPNKEMINKNTDCKKKQKNDIVQLNNDTVWIFETPLLFLILFKN